MTCSLCRRKMDYVHGHAACLNGRCPMFGRNQGECCNGETAGQCALPADPPAGGPAFVEASAPPRRSHSG